MTTMRLASISTRNQFGEFLVRRGLSGDDHMAVEVGTHRGAFASIFLNHWPEGTFYGVDHWSIPAGYEEQAKLLVDHLGGSDIDRGWDFLEARSVLEMFENRAALIAKPSLEAAKDFPDGRLSFVYLDGDHRFGSVFLDLRVWWKKLRPGGLLAGHDFLCPGTKPGDPDDWGTQIQPAVFSFAKARRLDVWVVVEEGGLPWSFFIVKPEEGK